MAPEKWDSVFHARFLSQFAQTQQYINYFITLTWITVSWSGTEATDGLLYVYQESRASFYVEEE